MFALKIGDLNAAPEIMVDTQYVAIADSVLPGSNSTGTGGVWPFATTLTFTKDVPIPAPQIKTGFFGPRTTSPDLSNPAAIFRIPGNQSFSLVIK